jgi:hypothetical protein
MKLDRTPKLVLAAAALIALAPGGPAIPCGYHGLIGGGFTAQHAGSIEVAIALREAVEAGVIEAHTVVPGRVDLVGFHRARKRLERLRKELVRQQLEGATVPAFSLLLIEPALWSRYDTAGGDVVLRVESEAALRTEPAVVTGGAVLAAIMSGTLTAKEATARGLLVVEGPPAVGARLSSLLAAALARLERRT